jgi:hypothetical protein
LFSRIFPLADYIYAGNQETLDITMVAPFYFYSRVILMIAAACIAFGGLYDVLTPRLPANLAAMCSGNEAAGTVMRELLRALGGCLVGIGTTVAGIVISMDLRENRRAIALILALVLPSEGLNAIGMRRAGSPYLIPVCFILLTITGATLALLAPEMG